LPAIAQLHDGIARRCGGPQGNGMSESVVNTFKRDDARRMNLADAASVMERLPGAFECFDTAHRNRV
jgi:hypothetical protein